MKLATLKQGGRVNLQCIFFDHTQLAGKGVAQFGQCWDAAPVAFDRRHPRPGLKQGTRQPARPGTDLEHFGIL